MGSQCVLIGGMLSKTTSVRMFCILSHSEYVRGDCTVSLGEEYALGSQAKSGDGV